jgi:predicted protein tyrosine phosphatase
MKYDNSDVILVMEKALKNKAASKFRDLLKGKKLVALDIPGNSDLVKTYRTFKSHFGMTLLLLKPC